MSRMCRATLNQKPPELKTDPTSPRKAPPLKWKITKLMNPCSQLHTTEITTKKITNLFHSCSMQHSRSEFSQGFFCCFFPSRICLPTPPPNRNLFRNRCRSRGIGCKCRIHIRPKAKLFSSKRWWVGPTHHACSNCEDLVRAENANKQTKSSTHAQTSQLTRTLDQRSVVRLDARSFTWSLAPLARRAFVCSQGANNVPPLYRPA